MNINKLVEELKGVPDAALIGYVKNQNSQVPSVLALAEISRRKEIRAAGNQQAQPQAAQPTVADQMTAPEQGVASLPVPEDMYGTQSMAAGGIVAFEDGGEVEHYAEGRLVEYKGKMYTPADLQYALAQEQSFLGGLGGKAWGAAKDLISAPFGYRTVWDPVSKSYKRASEMPSSLDEVRAAQAKEQAGIKGALTSQSPTNLAATREMISNAMNEPSMMDRMINIPTAPAEAPQAGGVKDIAQRQAAARQAAGAAGAAKPVVDAYGDVKFTPVTIDEAGYDAMAPKERAMRDYAAEFKAELGEDAGRAAMKDKLAKMQATGEKEAAQAPWMALAKAGLGMAAGKSPVALQNIAAGGIEGLKDYADARDNLKKAEERRFDLEAKVAQAERGEQLAAINYGADSKRADDASRRAVGLQKQADKANAAAINAKGAFEAVTKKYDLQHKDKELEMTAQHYQQMAAAYNKTPAEIQMVDQYAKAKKIPFDQAFEVVMGLKHPGSAGLDEDTMLRSYSAGVKDFSIDPAQTSYRAYKAQILGGGAPTTDYSKWGSPKISGK